MRPLLPRRRDFDRGRLSARAGTRTPALERITVVGASLAGLNAVEALREGGYGGALTLIGAEDRLPYDRPPLSKQVLAGEREPGLTALREPDHYDGMNLDLRLGRSAARLDPAAHEVVLDGGETIAYDGLVIATGASPRTLPGTPPLEGIHTLRTLDDCITIAEAFDRGPRVAIVGAGFIGAEVAATARGRGLEVTLIEAAPQPLVRALGVEMGAACASLHRDHGVDLRLGTGVEGFDGSDRVERVRLAGGATVEADVVVVGVGVSPATDWLEGSGLDLRDGVVCDSTCATGAPGVYAAGDVARWRHPLFDQEMRVEHWTNAMEQGRAAARNLLAGPEDAQPYAPVPYFWSNQYDIMIQFVGHAGPNDEVRVVRSSVEEHRFVAIYGRDGRVTGAFGMRWPRLVMAYRRMIGERVRWDAALAYEG